MDKLSRLEHIIKSLASENKGDAGAAGNEHAGKDVNQPESTTPGPDDEDNRPQSQPFGEAAQVSSGDESPLDVQFGRLVINDSKSYYVGNVLWANLANEVRPTLQPARQSD